jgi:hypothetical protein
VAAAPPPRRVEFHYDLPPRQGERRDDVYLCKFTPTIRETIRETTATTATTTATTTIGSLRRIEHDDVVLYKIGRSNSAAARRDALAKHYRGRYEVQLLDVYKGAGGVERHVQQHFANARVVVEDRSSSIRHREFFDFGIYGDEDPADVSARVEDVVESMVEITGGRRAKRRRTMMAAAHRNNSTIGDDGDYEDDDVDI